MDLSTQPTKKSKLTLYIVIALLLGIAVGFTLNKSYLAGENEKLTSLNLTLEK